MKPRKQTCSRCGGEGKILLKGIKLGRGFSYSGAKECPNCEGEGIEYVISFLQLEEYQMMKKHWKELNDVYQLHQIRAGNFILTDLKGKPLDAVSENKGKISI